MSNAICLIENCESPVVGRGWCNKHYLRFRKYGNPETIIKRETPETCSVEDCEKRATHYEYCHKHYNRWQRHGDPSYVYKRPQCSVDGCETVANARGLCHTHYSRWQRWGDPTYVLWDNYESTITEEQKRESAGIRCKMRRARKNGAAFIQSIDDDFVFEMFNFCCYLCGEALDYEDYNKYPTLDHITPLADGGHHTYANLAAAHRQCNRLKHAKSLIDFCPPPFPPISVDW